jgi:hypothetical protein
VTGHHGVHPAAKLVTGSDQIGVTNAAKLQIKMYVARPEGAPFYFSTAKRSTGGIELIGNCHMASPGFLLGASHVLAI